MKHKLVWGQMTTRYPWGVVWRSPKTGRRLTKHFESLVSAIHFMTTRAQYVDSRAAVISRLGYDIPTQLRGKIPKPWLWCPRCMTARKFVATNPQVTFYAHRKEWVAEKSRYEYRDRLVREMHCTHCGLTNRNAKMRRSNQPWTVQKIKPRRRRVKRR